MFQKVLHKVPSAWQLMELKVDDKLSKWVNVAIDPWNFEKDHLKTYLQDKSRLTENDEKVAPPAECLRMIEWMLCLDPRVRLTADAVLGDGRFHHAAAQFRISNTRKGNRSRTPLNNAPRKNAAEPGQPMSDVVCRPAVSLKCFVRSSARVVHMCLVIAGYFEKYQTQN